MSELRLINGFPANKTEIKQMSQQLIDTVIDGDVDPIKQVVYATAIRDVVKNFLDSRDVKDLTIREIAKYGKSASAYGATLTSKEGGVKYDYSVCNDPVYAEMVAQQEALKAKMKEREEYLKHIPELGQTVVNEETGEVSKIYRPARMATETIQVVFAK